MTPRERCALALLAVGGAAFLPEALNRFVFPKLFMVAVAVALAATAPARGRLPRGAVALLTAGTCVLLLAALAGATPAAQLIGLPPRYEGVVVLPLYVGAGVAGARLLGPQRARGSSRWFLDWLAVAALAIGTEAILETAGLRPLVSNVARPGSLLGNASDEGAWGVLALGPLAAAAIRVRGQLFSAGALAAVATIACSASRGALVGAVVVILLLGAFAPSRGVRTAFAGLLVMLTVTTFALPATRARVTGSGGDASLTVTGRELLWGETISLIADHPILGVGPSGYLNSIPRYHDTRYEREIGPANPPDSPHDWLLQATADGGVPLLLLAIGLAAFTLRRGWLAVGTQRTSGEAAVLGGLFAGLVGYGVALLFHFTSPGTTPLAAAFGGALIAVPPGRQSSDRLAALWSHVAWPVRILAIVTITLLAVVLAAGAGAEISLRLAIDDAATDHLAASNHQFQLAHDLRPWDPAIDETAAHAYATLASDGIAAAIPYGQQWSSKELAAWPTNVQALSDAATLALAAGQPDAASRLIQRALRLEPANPVLQRANAAVRRRITAAPG